MLVLQSYHSFIGRPTHCVQYKVRHKSNDKRQTRHILYVTIAFFLPQWPTWFMARRPHIVLCLATGS